MQFEHFFTIAQVILYPNLYGLPTVLGDNLDPTQKTLVPTINYLQISKAAALHPLHQLFGVIHLSLL
ncbi:MAG: hypothetical protein AAF902_01630 [Chloroflexota bacterium]